MACRPAQRRRAPRKPRGTVGAPRRCMRSLHMLADGVSLTPLHDTHVTAAWTWALLATAQGAQRGHGRPAAACRHARPPPPPLAHVRGGASLGRAVAVLHFSSGCQCNGGPGRPTADGGARRRRWRRSGSGGVQPQRRLALRMSGCPSLVGCCHVVTGRNGDLSWRGSAVRSGSAHVMEGAAAAGTTRARVCDCTLAGSPSALPASAMDGLPDDLLQAILTLLPSGEASLYGGGLELITRWGAGQRMPSQQAEAPREPRPSPGTPCRSGSL